jgi:hypothetical protein
MSIEYDSGVTIHVSGNESHFAVEPQCCGVHVDAIRVRDSAFLCRPGQQDDARLQVRSLRGSHTFKFAQVSES